MSAIRLLKSTPVLYVDAIEACLPFWETRLGFARTAEVPGDGGLAFVILVRDGIEVMLQTHAALAADPHASGIAIGDGRSALFVEVADLDAVAAVLGEDEIVMPRHRTFYGAEEIGVREPGGHFVTFARFGTGDA